MIIPKFPRFKTITIEDRTPIQQTLWRYQPETSELNFTNLFIWRNHYEFQWSLFKDWLFVVSTAGTEEHWALPPIGPTSRREATEVLLQWLKSEQSVANPRIERADRRLVEEVKPVQGLEIQPAREHFDYVYRTEHLIQLQGKKYHSKRNFINTFSRNHSSTYQTLLKDHLKDCLALADKWCEFRRCDEDMNLLAEWDAVREALAHFDELQLRGGIVLIQEQVEAFSLGERLNEQTAVIHVEKANPEVRGLYAVINQQFCENAWKDLPYVNREQDLGEEGLRKAKMSYHPDHMVEKFRIRLT